jgi:hypothetical protein
MVELPEWSAFDAKAAPVLPEHAERPGRLVALVATTEARDDGWAIEAAVALVRAWSESGRQVVLADTALADATLHEWFETDNAEGVTDTVLFGSSVRRVAKRSKDGSFFIITAGTASADSRAVLDSERWKRLSRGFVEAGVTLVSYVGAESDGKAAVLGLATDVIVLAGSAEAAGATLDGVGAPVRAFIGRPLGEAIEMPPVDVPAGLSALGLKATDASAGLSDPDEVSADLMDLSGEKWNEPDQNADSKLPQAEASIVEVSRARTAPVITGSRRLVVLAATVILVLILIAGAAALGWIDIPGISPQSP